MTIVKCMNKNEMKDEIFLRI